MQFTEAGRSLERLQRWVDRLSRDHISERTVAAADAALVSAFAETEAAAHVISGRLKASGRTSTDIDGSLWEGTITFGGPEAPYAEYEQARGGSHDPFAGLPAHEKAFESALNLHFEEGA